MKISSRDNFKKWISNISNNNMDSLLTLYVPMVPIIPPVFTIDTSFFLLLSPSCRGGSEYVQGVRWCVGDPLQQCDWARLAATGCGWRWHSVLGIVLPGALVQCSVEPRRLLCPAEVRSAQWLWNLCAATDSHQFFGHPAAAWQEQVKEGKNPTAGMGCWWWRAWA